jgi:hypothetical protein
MPKTKILARNPWTKEDVSELKAHSKAKTSVAEVAKTMKRTEGAGATEGKDDRHRSRSPVPKTATHTYRLHGLLLLPSARASSGSTS